MILPSSHLATLLIVIFGMLCWGLWANTFQAAGKWRFELYSFSFAAGAFLLAFAAALTLGTLGFDGFSLSDDILHAGKKQDVLALLAGIVFNLGNMLLVAAIGIAGMAAAFCVAMGIAIAVGVCLTFISGTAGNAAMMFAGAAILLVAVFIMIYAFRSLKLGQVDELVMTGKQKSTRRTVSLKGMVIAVISGVILSLAVPLLEKCQAGDAGLGPYAVTLLFTLGMAGSTLLYNLFFMNLPVEGKPLDLKDLTGSTLRQNLLALGGGALWCAGLMATLVAAHAEGAAAVSPVLIYAAAQGSAILAALCGIAIWKDFRGSDARVRALLFVVIALFICGLGMIAVGPAWTRT